MCIRDSPCYAGCKRNLQTERTAFQTRTEPYLAMFPVELFKCQDVVCSHSTRKLFSRREGDVSKIRQSSGRVAEVLKMLLLLLRTCEAGHRWRARLTAVTSRDATILTICLESVSATAASLSLLVNSTQLNFIKHICNPEAELLNTEAVLKVTRKNKTT